MIRFGPAGIPLSCKGRTLADGVEDVHSLTLSAMEVQMIRTSDIQRYPNDEEVGCALIDIEEDFVVGIIRDEEEIYNPMELVEEDDQLMVLPCMPCRYGELFQIGDMAKRLDVSLSIHTPYYNDLGSNDELTMSCINDIRHAALVIDALDGDMLVTNLGLYKGEAPNDEIDGNIIENVKDLMDWWGDCDLKPRFGVEVTGNQSVFGSIEQVLDLCDEIQGITPVLNFPHHHSRTEGSLLDANDFRDVLEMVYPYCSDNIHTAFSGVEHSGGNERRSMPIKRGDLKFEPLAEALWDMTPNATIISTSPLMEHDAMYMRVISERVLMKRVLRAIRERKKQQEQTKLEE